MKFYESLSLENLTHMHEGILYVEEWRPYPKLSSSQSNYEVSSFGRVKRIGKYLMTDGRWKPEIIVSQSKSEYLKFKSKSVHRMVASLFCSNENNKPQVNHIDADKYNNFFKNLEWCTQSENNKHAVEKSLCYQGAIRHLTFDDRMYIRENMNSDNRNELAKKFNITKEYVYFIGTNRDTLFMETKKVANLKRKKYEPAFKPIIDMNTGIFWNTDEVAMLLNTKRRYIHRMLSEERKPNKTQYRYA